MNEIKFFQVDAFNNQPFKGNPAAICLLEEDLDANTMQKIAAENNLAETAFVRKISEGFDLRWFTPTVEVDLCGHATLATAHVLWQEDLISEEEEVNFRTRSGLLKAARKGDWIQLDFPAAEITDIELPAGISNALNADPINAVYAKDRFIIELSTAEQVQYLSPDLQALKGFDMIVVTSKGNPSTEYDFVSRSFGPSVGIDEDPVTGSSHCGLVPYWAGRLNKTEFFADQVSARGGELKLKLADKRVLMSGQAVTIIRGHFYNSW